MPLDHPSEPPVASRLPTRALLLALGLAQLWFLVRDQRVPMDQVFLFSAVPVVRDALALGQPGRLLGLLSETAGWANLLVVGLLEWVGPSPAGVRAFGVLASLLVVAGVGALARRQGGERAALGAVGLAAAIPMIAIWGRLVWFHVPEAALVTGLALLVHGDPRLERRGAAAGAALLGAAALTLRETGLFWLLTLLPLLLRARGRRWALPGLAWAAAAVVPISRFAAYLGNKWGARGHYAAQVASFPEQLAFMVGWGALALALAGLVAALWRRDSPARDGERALQATLLAWVLAGPALVLVFHAGLDNHTLFAVGLSALGGVGLARLRLERAAVGLALVFHVLALTPEGSPLWPLRERLAGVVAPQRSEPLDDYARPWTALTLAEQRALFAACPAPCVVLVQGGLFRPGSESGGGAELWALGVSARLVPMSGLRPKALQAAHFDAAARWDCGEAGPAGPEFEAIAAANGLSLQLERPLTRSCALQWWAPAR